MDTWNAILVTKNPLNLQQSELDPFNAFKDFSYLSLSSFTYVILLISTLNARAARLHMISLDHGERDGI